MYQLLFSLIYAVFNEYFSTIASETASTIPDTPTHFSNFLPPKDNPQTMFIKPIKPFEILEIVHNLDATKSPGYDDINTHVIKRAITLLTHPLCNIYNLSIETGTSPSGMKIASHTNL